MAATEAYPAEAYPARVDAFLDLPLSRWLWLVKWVLVIPHYIVLAFLWIAFWVLTAVAFFAIAFTGRYPRAIFEFNVGVLRWSWRVQYYAIGAFGTDRYPPFSLADDRSYPARLEIEYPERLSRGLVLVKWWLLAIPHYIIIGVFAGGGLWFVMNAGPWFPGLIGLVALIGAIVLAVTGSYPRDMFDFVLGMNRWTLRVAAYSALMTDAYPPFRLDMGGTDPGSTLVVPPPRIPRSPQEGRKPEGWTGGRIVAVVAGAVLAVCSIGQLGAGGVALWAQTTQRHGGYVDIGSATYQTTGYALVNDGLEVHAAGVGWDVASKLFGTVRINVTATDGSTPVFVGIAPSTEADQYLTGVAYSTVRDLPGHRDTYLWHPGAAPQVPPGRAGIWAGQAAGAGTQSLRLPANSGDWTVAVLNADGTRPVSVRVQLAATLPALSWIAASLLIVGFLGLAGGIVLIAVPIARASRPRDRDRSDLDRPDPDKPDLDKPDLDQPDLDQPDRD